MSEEELFNLIDKLDSDSKTESSSAQFELIDALEPIIRAWSEIYSEYGDYSISIDSLYNPCRGKLVGVSYDKQKGRLIFKYTDVGDVEDYIYVSTDIISKDFLKRKRMEIKYMTIMETQVRIANLQENLAELEGFLDKIQNEDE